MASPFDRPPAYFVDLEMRIVDPRLVDIHRHWLSLRAGGDVPQVDRFDPLDLARHLGHLFIVRVEHGGERDAEPAMRYALIGTHLVEDLGRDVTGQLIVDTFPPGHPVVDVYRHLLAHRVPVRTHGRLDWVDRVYRRFESVLLPLADAEGRIVKVLGAAINNSDDASVVREWPPA